MIRTLSWGEVLGLALMAFGGGVLAGVVAHGVIKWIERR